MTDSTTDKSNRDDGGALDKSVVKGSALASIDSSLPQTTLPRADSSGISAQIEVSKPSAGRDEFLAGLQHELETGEDRVVTARGTEDGLVLRIDGKAEWREIIAEIEAFLGGRRKFFEVSEIGIEGLERLPTVEQGKELETHLRESYCLEIRVRRRR